MIVLLKYSERAHEQYKPTWSWDLFRSPHIELGCRGQATRSPKPTHRRSVRAKPPVAHFCQSVQRVLGAEAYDSGIFLSFLVVSRTLPAPGYAHRQSVPIANYPRPNTRRHHGRGSSSGDSTWRIACCASRSTTVGMPGCRTPPPGFVISTPQTPMNSPETLLP